MMTALSVDSWWDQPEYRAAQETFTARGAFTLAKLQAHNAAKLKDVLADVFREAVPDPQDITKFQWQTILAYLGATAEEVKAVQVRMGRVWR